MVSWSTSFIKWVWYFVRPFTLWQTLALLPTFDRALQAPGLCGRVHLGWRGESLLRLLLTPVPPRLPLPVGGVQTTLVLNPELPSQPVGDKVCWGQPIYSPLWCLDLLGHRWERLQAWPQIDSPGALSQKLVISNGLNLMGDMRFLLLGPLEGREAWVPKAKSGLLGWSCSAWLASIEIVLSSVCHQKNHYAQALTQTVGVKKLPFP